MAERIVNCIRRIIVTIYTCRSPIALMSFRGVPRGCRLYLLLRYSFLPNISDVDHIQSDGSGVDSTGDMVGLKARATVYEGICIKRQSEGYNIHEL